MSKLKVFLTGATGRVGRVFVPAFREVYQLRTLYRRPAPHDPAAILGDLHDAGKLRSGMDGFDVLVHLAAVSWEAPFVEELVPANIAGVYTIFQAAKEAGVRRIVYASTCHVVQVRAAAHTIDADAPLQPDSLYGASKAFGEVLGRFYHDRFGIELVAIRIGWLLPYDDPELGTNNFKRRTWLSHRDGIALFRLAIEKPDVGFAVVHGTSITAEEILGLSSARELLGYDPQDDVVALYGPGPDAEREDHLRSP